MHSFIKRVTSAVVAGAVVFGSIALYPDSKKNLVNAAETKYDSANLVNYATIMGRAVDYGIVSQSLTQSQHMETTFATFTYSRTKDTTTDVDLTNAKTAQFIVGEIASTGDFGTLKFGKVRTSTGQVYVENMRITLSEGMDPDTYIRYQDDVAQTTTFNYSFRSRQEIQESIDTVIDHARDESGEMVTRTGDSDYVLDSSDNNLVSVNGAVTTININDPKYDNKVVYINLDDPKFASLLSNWASEPNGHHLDINKRSSTVIVFTTQKTTPITLGKVSVYAPDSPWYSSAPSDGVHDYDYYSSVTTHSGNQSTHNTYVDMEIAQKLIWNITKSNEIQIESSAGTFLCLAGDKNNRNVKVTLDNNPCAGWLVVNGNVENKCEYHYIYGGNSQSQQTEGNGQLHYVARKGFTTKYANKDTISQYVDNSVDFDEGDYQFFWQEYTNANFDTTVGSRQTVDVKETSYLEFPTITFTASDSTDPHYVTSTPKDFYFRITENPAKSLSGIKNSAGYINICLRVYVADDGEIRFKTQTVTMIGDDENHLIQYDKNGTWGSETDWVDVVNARFDLGAFFNRVKVPGYMTLTKTIEGDVTEEDLAGLTFTVTDGEDFTVEYKLGRDFTKNTSGVYELTTPLTVPDSETKYTVTETLYSLDGYKLEEVSYTVDGGETQHDNDTASLNSVSTDSNNPTTVAYTDSYTPLGTLKVHKTAVDNNNKNINYYYEFSVKKGENQYLQADKQSFDSTEYYFTIGTNEEQVFENIPVGLYTITEKTDELFVYGYTFEKEISKISGTADVTKKSTVDFTLENKFTQDLGNLEVTKTAKDNNGNAVEGTFKFTISTPMRGFLQADGTFGNEKHYFTISTGQTLTFENLPVDNYMITEDTESVSVTGYTFNMDASKYSVLGKVTKNGNTNVKLENDFTQDVGTLSVKKTAQDNHDTNVSGTFEFSVKNSKGQFLQADKTSFDTTEVFFTVEAGSHTDFENLPVGKYTVTEKTSSISVEGYTFTSTGSTTSDEATVTKGETSDAQLVNKFIQDLGTLTVAKVAKDNNDKDVEGSFLFSVKNSTGKFLQSDEETFTDTEYFFTVAAGSSKTFTDLPVGTYTISEKTTGVSVPGYTYLVDDSTTKGTGTVSKVTTANSTVTLENKFEQDVGSLTVSKTAKDDNNENVSGSFKFSVKNSVGLYLQSDKKTFDTEVYFFTIAAGSTAVFNNLPVGVYTVTEDANSVAVTGYTFISSSIPEVEAEVEKNESVTAELVNNYEKDVGNLVVSKTAKDNNDKSVAGSFKFSVKNSVGMYLQSDKKTFDTAEYFFTVASGSTAEFNNLPVGVYTVTEDPDSVGVTGYTFESGSTTHVEAEVVKNDSVTAELVNNYTQDTGSLTVKKSAIDNYDNTVNGTFKFSVKNSNDKFLQEDEKSFEDEAFFFTVAAGSSKTFENLPVGTYKVEEDTGSVSVTGYTFNENDSKTYAEATVIKDGNADAELENKFTLDLGSLKITKDLGEGYPEEARTKAYNFIINGPDDYSEMRTVTGADSVIITGLKPGKYTVTEDTNDAKIEGYDLEVTGGGEVTVVGKAEAATTITNTYTLQTGSLKITKALGDSAPEEAALKTYSFTITGPNNYSKTVSVDGAGYVIVEDLVPGKYTVTENTEGTAIEGYDLEVTGGGEVNVVAKATALTTVTNTYKLQLGSLKITKVLGANAPESALTKTYKFMITGPDNYSKTVSVEGAGYVIVSDLVPGSYTVTEVLDGAAIADYDLEVTGGGEVNVVAKDVAGTTITNTYTRQVGSLKITKVLGANAPESAASKSYSFTITGPDNYSKTVSVDGAGYVIIPNLIPGTYTVTEDTDGADIDGYDLEVTGGGEVEVVANAAALTTVTNTYTLQTGSLKITKALGANAPASASSKTYTFTVTGPNNYSKTVTIEGAGEEKIEGLVPGTYTVTEDTDDAEIDGYDLEVTGGGEVNVVAKDTAETTVTNTYTLQTGSLKIFKTLGADAPESAKTKSYSFVITGPNEYSKEVAVIGTGSVTVDNLVPGSYTVTEVESGAAIADYDLEVTGGGQVSVVAKDVAETTVTNTYTKQTGSLTVTKTATDNDNEAVNDTFYFSVKNSEGEYLQSDEKSFGTTEVFFSVISGSSKTFSDLPVGEYTVTEDTTRVEVTGYDFLTTSTTEKTANVTKSATPATAALVNNYEKHLGTLTVQKTAKDNYNDDVTGTFEFSVKNGDNKYLQSDEKTFGDAKYFFTVEAGSSKTFENLPAGKYQVEEKTDDISVSGYTFVLDDSKTSGTGSVSKTSTEHSTVTLENMFIKDVGALKITKALGANAPDGAASKKYTFTVTGPDNFSKTVTIEGAGSETLTDLVPGSYTVTENLTDAAIDGYDLEVTGGGEVTVEVNEVAGTTVTNTYTKQKGSLTITKALGANAPESAKTKSYTFTITGPNNYSKEVAVIGASSVTVDNLEPGTYRVSEDSVGAIIRGYDVVIRGGGEVNVEANAVAEKTVTNTYVEQKGYLNITKALGEGAPDDASSKTYSFTVTGPDNYSNTVEIKAGESLTIGDLKPGKYTVTENLTGTAIDGYDLEVTGGGEVTVVGNSTAKTTITNTYTKQTGSLKITKALGANAPESASSKSYTFVITGPDNYSKEVAVIGASSVTVDNLVPGNYTVTEVESSAAIDKYDLEVTGGGEVAVAAKATAETTVTNTYTQQTGSLKITKALGANAPAGAASKEYTFTVTGPDNYSETVTITGAGSKTLTDLVPGTYTVTENESGADIDGYDLEVTGGGEVTVAAKATAETTITNTYTQQKGALKITKALGEGAPDAADNTEYKFTITGPDNYSKTVTIKGAGSETVENLEPGNYTVTEDKDGAKIANYDLTVTGDDGKTIEVKSGETAEAKITNTYEDNTSSGKGKLTITKTITAGAPEEADDTVFAFTVTGIGFSQTVFITGEGSATIDNLEPGRYTVTENKDAAKIDNYDLEVTGDEGEAVEVVAGKTTTAAITNTYKDTSSSKGSLKITKSLGEGAPEAANDTEFKFTITGPDNYSKTVTIKGAGSETIVNLEPGNYTVTEDKDGAKITNYDLTVTGDDGKTIEVKAGETAEAKITNTYEDNTSSTKGSLKITKKLGANAPQAAGSKEYKFTITGPDNYSKPVTIKGAGSATIEGLEPGKYTVTEDKDDAQINNYELTVTGDDGKEIEVKAGETAEAEITNTYDDNTMSDKGSLKISKTLGANAPSAASDKSFTFTVTGPDNYSKTVTIKGTGSVTIDELEPGNYTVTENEESAAITNYKLTVTGDNGKAIEVKAGKTSNAAITNTYEDSSLPETGSLKITKALGSGAPSAANSTEYKFNVTGPDGYSKTITIKGAGSFTITGLTPGNYKVTEDKASANITNYDLEVTGGGNVEVKAGEIAESKITNTYKDNSSQVDTGSLTVSKIAVDASENPITGSFKFSVKNSEGKYLQQNEKDFDTSIYLFTINSGDSKKFTGLPVGTYTVEEDISDMSVEGNYELLVSESDISVDGNVTKNGNAEAKLFNYFVDGGVPTPAPTGAVTVTKKVAGNTAGETTSTYSFYVKCGDQYVQDDSTGALGSDKHAFTVDPSSSEGTTITGLALGKTYVIEETSVSAASGFTCATTYTESNTVVLDKENKTGSVKITNTYIDTSKPDDSGNETGILKVTKKVTGSTASSGMPAEYRFTVSFSDGDETLYIQDTAGTTGSEKHEFAVSGNSSVVITGLALDVEYKVEEVKVTGVPSDYTCKTSYTDGGTITLDSSSKTGTVVITNNYSYKAPEPEPTTGSLTITKGLNSGAPSSAKSKTYTFKVTGNGETRTVTIKGANSKTIHDLVPGTYTVSEERDGISINKYSVSVSGEGNVTIEAGKTAKIKITNTYDDITGSLKITKALASGAPDAAQNKTYKFTVTGPDDYSETVEIKGAGSKTLTGLMPGKYTVTENESAAAIDGYNLTVTGDNVSKNVETKGVAYVTITNAYEQKMGTLCFTKTFGGDVTESEANGGDLYFIIENTDTSIEARYLKPDGTFTADKSEAHITLAHLEKTTATNGKFAFKKNFTVPVGNYKVTEENTNVYFRGTSEPITMANSSVTSSVADITDGNTTDVELSDVYELNDNLKVTFNKEDEAHNLIAQAQLTLKSVDGYDLSNVKVTQGGTQVAVTLSADKSSISFYTVDTDPSIVSGLKAGDYELTETVTPPKYKTADAIRFTLYPDGNTKRVGDVTVSGSPIVMIDKADPNYHQGGNNPPIPATGEVTSATTMIGAALMVLAAACFTGLYIFRTKKKKQAE